MYQTTLFKIPQYESLLEIRKMVFGRFFWAKTFIRIFCKFHDKIANSLILIGQIKTACKVQKFFLAQEGLFNQMNFGFSKNPKLKIRSNPLTI